MTESIVSVVIQRLSILLNEETIFFQRVSNHVNEILAELRKIQDSLKDADLRQDRRGLPNDVSTWLADARKLAYDAEDLLEGFVLNRRLGGGIKSILKRYVCILGESTTLDRLKRQIQSTKAKISELLTHLPSFESRNSKLEVDESSSSAHEIIMPKVLRRYYSHVVGEPEIFVGFIEDVKVLLEHLVNDRDRVVTIHGMGGVGKTTLARKIYNHKKIKRHFTCLAWVSISQKWETRYVLQKILLQLVQDPKRKEAILQLKVEQLRKEIFGVYQNKKCLVVLDDIWSNNSWKDLNAAFSTEGHGVESKLLLTTRNVEVAKHVDSEGFFHQPRLLTEKESWDLLYEKAFPKNDPIAPKHVKRMEELGKEMVSHCGGLPLAVVVLGGILVTKPTLTEWERVHRDIESSIRKGQGMGEQLQNEVQEILVKSFDDLPWQLVSCFMYLSKFPEDTDIETEKLYQLWMAEGLLMTVDQKVGETMMDVAECYLGELVHRSMVQVEFEEEESLLRKFKVCRLHDLMRDLSLKKAEEVDLFKAFDFRHDNSDDEVVESSSSSGNATRRLVIYFGDLFKAFDFRHGNNDDKVVESSSSSGNATRQLVIYFGDNNHIIRREAVVLPDKKRRRHLRSNLLFFRRGDSNSQSKLRSYVHDFQLLRVLAIEEFNASDYDPIKFSQAIGSLIYLRYLSLKNSWLNINLSCIANLEHLQTLDLRLRYASLPFLDYKANILQKVGRLQHLYLPPKYDNAKMNNKLVLNGLSNLETLVNFNPNVCDLQGPNTLQNLRKLTCAEVKNIENLEYLVNNVISNRNLRYSSLQISSCDLDSERGATLLKQMMADFYKLFIEGPIAILPCDDNVRGFSSNLTTLSLKGSNLREDPMTTLEKYPNLRFLSLGNAYLGTNMVCSSTGFPKLTRLNLMSLSNLEEWRLDQGGMPKLFELIVYQCKRLQMLPNGLRFLTLIRELIIRKMPEEFCDRVRVVDDGTIEGQDFYKVSHVSRITIEEIDS